MLKPLGNRVVVKLEEALKKTSGGILLVDGIQSRNKRGTVVAVGPGELQDDGTRKNPQITEGDVVYFGDGCGSDIEIDDEKYLVIVEPEIIAIEVTDEV